MRWLKTLENHSIGDFLPKISAPAGSVACSRCAMRQSDGGHGAGPGTGARPESVKDSPKLVCIGLSGAT
jgi:hypothetical protein